MLEQFTNQASGLLGLCAQSGPRMIAVVHHGDEQAELPMLWQLCLTLVNLGYSVTVLDATTDESTANPGLDQLLDDSHWHGDDAQDAPAWTVLPSAKGVEKLCSTPAGGYPNLHQLGRLLPVDSIIILYCRVESMITLIRERRLEPLLAVSPARTSLLTSYIALKRLLITGNLKPTIVNMIQDQDLGLLGTAPPVSAGLSECAKKFLNFDVATFDITEQHGEAHPNGDIQRLALRMLERSAPLSAKYEPMGRAPRAEPPGHSGQIARSH